MKNSIRSFVFAAFLACAAASFCQDSGSLPVPDNLITDGIPAIPQSVVDSVGRYTEFRSATFAGWAPDKRSMLILTRFGDTNQVHSVAMPGGDRHQLTFFPDAVQRAFYGPVSSDWFLFHKAVGGDEQFQFYRYDMATGESTLLTDGKSRNTDGSITYDGKQLVYMSTRRTGSDTDLYMLDILNPSTDHMVLQLQGGGWAPTDISDDSKTAIIEQSVSVNESHLWLADLATGKIQRLTPANGPEIAYGAAAFGPEYGKSLFVVSDEGGEFAELRRMDLQTGKSVSLTSDIPWDVEGFAISRDRSQIAFSTNENGMSVLYILDTKSGKYKKADGIPVGVMGSLAWHNNGRDVGFNLNSATTSLDAYSYDTVDGKLTRWTASETGGLNAANFQQQQLIKWKSFDGKEISGWLTMPPAKFTGPRPVMMDIHGGPEDEARPIFQGRYNYYINELGIAVIEPNIRGSTGFGKTFSKLDNGVLRGDSYKDIGALLDWIKTQPNLDANKVMVTGGSYGGHMTYAISYAYADRIACSLPIVGMTNLVTFLENTSGYRRDLRRVEYGDERDPATRKVLEDIAPMNHSSEITKPIFIVAGQNDPRVPISEATQFQSKIKTTNSNVWFLVAKDEGHGFIKKKNRDFQMYATVMFMQKFLLGGG